MKDLLNIFRNRLLDLSSSNRSVFLPKVYKGKFSDLKSWDYLSASSSLDIVKAMLAGKTSIKIADVKHLSADQLEEVLEEAKKLIRTRQLIFDETGSADFYIGWPYVEGVMKNGMPLRAPLIFFPYQLIQVGREIYLEKGALDEPFWNRSLFLSLSHFEEYAFDSSWLEAPVAALEDKPDEDFRIGLLDALKKQGWHPAFEREFLSENLIHFLPISKSDLVEKYTPGQYQLKPYAIMGLFPQSASYIHSDYDFLKENASEHTLESILAAQYQGTEQKENSKQVSLEFTPLAVDGSQESIIAQVSSGQSLVVQGPPGSGKTQLICNLIAQFIGKGKKVLVVCQKKAALDVIYERLQSIELAPFVSLLHDAVAGKKTLYEKIADQIQSSEQYKNQNIHPDTIVLEKEFSRIQASIARQIDFFSKYKQALFDTQVGGETAHALYLKSDKKYPVVNLDLEFQSILANEIESKSGDLDQFLFYHSAIQYDFELIHAAVNTHLSIDDKEQMLLLLEKTPVIIHQLQGWNEQENLLTAIDLSFALSWMQKIRTWVNDSLIYQHRISFEAAEHFSPEHVADWKLSVQKHFAVLNRLTSQPPTAHQERWKESVNKASQGGWKQFVFKWQLTFSNKELKQWLSSNHLDSSKESILFLTQVFSSMDTLHALKEKWSAHSFLITDHGLSERLFLNHLQTFDRIQQELVKAGDIPALKVLWRTTLLFRERLDQLLQLVQERNHVLSPYFLHWKPKTVDRLFLEDVYRTQWTTFVKQRFERWLGYEQLKQNLDLALFTSFHKVIREVSSEDKAHVTNTWKQSVYRAWIEEKERVFPILKSVSTPEWEMNEQELQTLVNRRYVVSLEFLKIKLREWVYAGIQYNRLNRQVTYRDLNHQVNKKRSVWPVRKLIAQHEEEILDLIPCWLVSPETASTVFPMHNLFDLVIFDEASQCFVEKAFPSLFRAKQAVVIGDDKQLKPSDLYRVRYKSEDEEEEIDHEVESLLDFSSRYFPSNMLTGHYRSKSEDLIRFSNEHFYNNRLRIVPDIAYANTQVLQYLKVEGRWINNTNAEEAKAVAELVAELMHTHPGKSIGIITFNYPQAFLIKDTLDQSGMALPQDLLIKNIENVQGDERDIIIFSVAYARNKEGKIVTQFGSLSQDGGENRLNVAVTRAREKVFVVSSILPEELKVEHHKNKGAELLKQYMQYVYQFSKKRENKSEVIQPDIRFSKSHTLSEVILQVHDDKFTSSYFADLQDKRAQAHLVFTDDQRYFYSPSVTDWHAYTPNLFQGNGWKTDRFYSRNYWFDAERFWENLK
ncbi:MAG: superfamily helicase [Chitinophagaceae bacterium]|nr:superfamily helicase [Chitinophagaceae bacterium]